MASNHRSLRSTITGVTSAALVAGLAGMVLAPAVQADTGIQVSTASISHTVPAMGDATTTGARVLGLPAAGLVNVGGLVTANFGAVSYADAYSPSTYTYTWFGCSSRTQALDTCAILSAGFAAGDATRKGVGYVVKEADLGKYIVFGGTVNARDTTNELRSSVVVSNRADAPLAIPTAIPTSPRPVIGVNDVVAGQAAGLITGTWTMPTGQTFASRLTTAWACPDANAGQTPDAAFSTSGCVSVPVTSSSIDNTVNNVATHRLTTTAAMAGKYLVAMSTVVAKASSGQPYLYTVRSATALLPAPAAAPTPPADATPPVDITAPVDIIAPVQPTMTVVAKKVAERGKKLLVAVKLAGKGAGTVGTGPAIVELVKSNRSGAKAVKKLRTIEVESLRGARYEVIPARIKKGDYFLRVVFTDAGSGVQAASLKKLRIR